jgi:cell division protein ZapA
LQEQADVGRVSVAVNGRSYAVICDDGQETRTRRLAQYVDAKVADFAGTVGQIGEARLILLAALVIADELADAKEALQQERDRAQAAESGADGAADAAANGIEGITQQVEAIAARLETP